MALHCLSHQLHLLEEGLSHLLAEEEAGFQLLVMVVVEEEDHQPWVVAAEVDP